MVAKIKTYVLKIKTIVIFSVFRISGSHLKKAQLLCTQHISVMKVLFLTNGSFSFQLDLVIILEILPSLQPLFTSLCVCK